MLSHRTRGADCTGGRERPGVRGRRRRGRRPEGLGCKCFALSPAGALRVQVGLRAFCTGFPCGLAPVFSVHTDVAGKFPGLGRGGRRQGPDSRLTCAKGITEDEGPTRPLLLRHLGEGWAWGAGWRIPARSRSRSRSPGSHGGGGGVGGCASPCWVWRAPGSLLLGVGWSEAGLLGQVLFFVFVFVFLITGMFMAPSLPSVCPVEGWGLLFKT